MGSDLSVHKSWSTTIGSETDTLQRQACAVDVTLAGLGAGKTVTSDSCVVTFMEETVLSMNAETLSSVEGLDTGAWDRGQARLTRSAVSCLSASAESYPSVPETVDFGYCFYEDISKQKEIKFCGQRPGYESMKSRR